jgi:hypothetical protein
MSLAEYGTPARSKRGSSSRAPTRARSEARHGRSFGGNGKFARWCARGLGAAAPRMDRGLSPDGRRGRPSRAGYSEGISYAIVRNARGPARGVYASVAHGRSGLPAVSANPPPTRIDPRRLPAPFPTQGEKVIATARSGTLYTTEVTSANTKPSRSTMSPSAQRIGRPNSGPSWTKVWNSPFSPQGSTPGGSSASRRSS